MDDMKTKPKMDLRFYIERAVKDFKTLVIYFNVTRPQYEPAFRDKNGKFSFDKLKNIQHYLKAGWRVADDVRKYNRLSAAYNYTFGIPNELVRKVLGEYVDDNGKHIRIPVKSIVNHLQKVGFLGKVTNDGKSLVKDKETGKYRTICHWRQKYPLANVKYWAKLISDENYRDLDTIPNASSRVKRIIMKWHMSWAGDKQDAKQDNEVKTSDSESRGRELVKYVENIVSIIGQTNIRRTEIEELRKMRDSEVERICDLMKKHYLDSRASNRAKWERSSTIKTAIRTAYPEASDDFISIFAEMIPSYWDSKGARK